MKKNYLLILFVVIAHISHAQMVQQITSFTGDQLKTGIDNFVSTGDIIYFAADTSSGLKGLWVSDGTPENTKLVRDSVDANPLNPWRMEAIDGKAYFQARLSDNTRQLFTSDGTKEGTIAVTNVAGDFECKVMGVNDSLVFMRARVTGDAEAYELWIYNVNADSVWRPEDLGAGTTNGFNEANLLHSEVFNGTMFFRGREAVTYFNELAYYDIENDTIKFVTDFASGSNAADIKDLTAVGDKMFFRVKNDNSGVELGVTDGTEVNTELISIRTGTSGSDPGNMRSIGDSVVYFAANDGSTGKDPWISNGTVAGTRKLINLNGATNCKAQQFTGTDDGLVYFRAEISGTFQTFVTDGTEGNTKQLLNVRNNNIKFVNGNSVFAVLQSDGTGSIPINTGAELYVLQNDTAYIIADLAIGGDASGPSEGFSMLPGNKMTFMTTNTTFGKNLYIYEFDKFQTIGGANDFGYVDKDDISDTLSINLKDSTIIDHIIITPPANFEISTNLGDGFRSTVDTVHTEFNTVTGAYELLDTNLYIRMVPGGAENSFNGNVEITGIAMETKAISVSGNSMPTLVNDILLSSESLTDEVEEGQTLQIYADVKPDDATDTTLVFSVENVTGAATIDPTSGLLSATTAGTVTVKAKANDAGAHENTLSITITAADILVNDILLSSESMTNEVTEGETLQIYADVKPDDATDTTLVFSVENGTGAATIDPTSGLLSATTAGTVTVKATANDAGAHDNTLSITITEGSDINTLNNAILSVYPNPVNDKLYISVELSNVTYKVYDIHGKVISTGVFSNEETINTSEWQSGMYLLQLTSDNASHALKVYKE